MIGVDVGGTKVSAATLHGAPVVHPTDCSSTQALIDQLVAAVGEVAAGETPAAVGFGIPSVVEFETGLVRSSTNIPLADVPLREVLRERLGTEVFVDNDATVAALAEAHDEHGRLDVGSLVMITVGTGIGGGIVIDGHAYRGATGAAGELGHTLVMLAESIPAATRFPSRGRWRPSPPATSSTASPARPRRRIRRPRSGAGSHQRLRRRARRGRRRAGGRRGGDRMPRNPRAARRDRRRERDQHV